MWSVRHLRSCSGAHLRSCVTFGPAPQVLQLMAAGSPGPCPEGPPSARRNRLRCVAELGSAKPIVPVAFDQPAFFPVAFDHPAFRQASSGAHCPALSLCFAWPGSIAEWSWLISNSVVVSGGSDGVGELLF